MDDLANAPLVQASFEVRWRLNQNRTDDGYPLIVGPLRSAFSHLGELERLPANDLPAAIAAHRPTLRFGPANGPAAFVGPGIAAWVTGGSYCWADYRSGILELMSALTAAYTEQVGAPPIFEAASLRYVNEVPQDSSMGLLEFVRDRLHIDVRLPDSIVNHEAAEGGPIAFQLRYGLPLARPDAAGTLDLEFDVSDGTPVVRWSTDVFALDPLVPQDLDAIENWIDQAHIVNEDWFAATIEGELHEEFSRGRTEDAH